MWESNRTRTGLLATDVELESIYITVAFRWGRLKLNSTRANLPTGLCIGIFLLLEMLVDNSA